MSTTIEENIPLLEHILSEWKGVIGKEYQGYRNHAYRMIYYCLALHECTDEEREKIIIGGVSMTSAYGLKIPLITSLPHYHLQWIT